MTVVMAVTKTVLQATVALSFLIKLYQANCACQLLPAEKMYIWGAG
jgi:hypothetical protein